MNRTKVEKKLAAIKPNYKGSTKPAIPYKKRGAYFEGSNVNFFPETMRGYSYGWWELAKQVKGVMLLNVFNYSPSTVRHRQKMFILLNQLRIKFKTIEAPNGLQDLHHAVTHTTSMLAKAMVENKYARTKNKTDIKKRISELELLKRLGFKYSAAQIEEQCNFWEQSRNQRLAAQRFKRDQVKQAKGASENVPKLDLSGTRTTLNFIKGGAV